MFFQGLKAMFLWKKEVRIGSQKIMNSFYVATLLFFYAFI